MDWFGLYFIYNGSKCVKQIIGKKKKICKDWSCPKLYKIYYSVLVSKKLYSKDLDRYYYTSNIGFGGKINPLVIIKGFDIKLKYGRFLLIN